MPPVTLPAPEARLAQLIAALCAAIAARLERPGKPGLAGTVILLICTRLQRMAARIARLAARAAAGPLPPPRPRPPRPRPAPSQPYQRLPRRHAWLVVTVPAASAMAEHLRALLADPAAQALIAAAPQLGRTLRPLCRMLGVRLPPILRPPPRAKAGGTRPADPPRADPARPLCPSPAPEVAGPPGLSLRLA